MSRRTRLVERRGKAIEEAQQPPHGLADAERALKQAQQILRAGRPGDDAEEWLLLATLIGEADLAYRDARRGNPSLTFPRLEAVLEELHEMTAGFTDPVFLRLTRAARRRNPSLFG